MSVVFSKPRAFVNNLNKLAYLLGFQHVCICLKLKENYWNNDNR